MPVPFLGYADGISRAPGQQIRFMLSTREPRYTAALVRLTDGYSPDAPFRTEVVLPDVGTFAGREQAIHPGSYARVPLDGVGFPEGEVTFTCWLWHMRRVLDGPQTVAALDDALVLVIEADGRLAARARDLGCILSRPLEPDRWYAVAASRGGGRVTLAARDVTPGFVLDRLDERVSIRRESPLPERLAALTLAASGDERARDPFSGKIERPALFQRLLTDGEVERLARDEVDAARLPGLVAAWDMDAELAGDRLVDAGPRGMHGRLFQCPTRGVTGHRWDGTAHRPADNAAHYGAIHFHADDLDDAGWTPDITLDLPRDLRSGVYALAVTAGGGREYFPFFVRPADDETTDVLFLAPTNTYLAYANEHLVDLGLQSQMAHETVLNDHDAALAAHPEVGKAVYDLHDDGSGVAYSSRRRPVLNLRPNYRTWLNGGPRHFAADLWLVGWLERRGARYAVATDEDLHRERLDLLRRCKVLVTGTHPEYWTRPMLDALDGWLRDGGRLMYLGGNGFYWVTGMDAAHPHRVEVRRGYAGTRSWNSAPGELHLSTTGDLGGLWRHAGYPPHALVGVGYTAEGWGGACGYRREESSFSGPWARLFTGVDADVIGAEGYALGGAVGDEIDRGSYELGTPAHATWLATSTGLNNMYRLAHEDLLYSQPDTGGAENPLVRADMVVFETEGGGRVFSVGSIQYAAALAWNGYDNAIRRLTDNVLRAWLE